MSSIFKEYSFVIVSMVSAICFFIALAWMMKYENKNSIIRMMDYNVQYANTNNNILYGNETLDDSMSQINQNNVPYIHVDGAKDYHIENTFEQIETTTEDGLTAYVVPAIQPFKLDFIMEGVTVDNADVSDIQLTVIDYTPTLDTTVDTNQNTIWGKTVNEEVIAVDKYGNRKLSSSEADGYKKTERLAYEQRQVVDSTTLAADEYNTYYGNVYYYRSGAWYQDNGDGEFSDSDKPIDEITFSTDVPHKFKVIYRVTGTNGATSEGQALKSEVTKLFVAKSRYQKNRSIAVYKEIYQKNEPEGAGVPDNISPDSIEANMSSLGNYSGLTGDDVVNNAIQDKLDRVRNWQEEEREREAAEEDSETPASTEPTSETPSSEPTPSSDTTPSSETTPSSDTTPSSESTPSTDNTTPSGE